MNRPGITSEPLALKLAGISADIGVVGVSAHAATAKAVTIRANLCFIHTPAKRK